MVPTKKVNPSARAGLEAGFDSPFLSHNQCPGAPCVLDQDDQLGHSVINLNSNYRLLNFNSVVFSRSAKIMIKATQRNQLNFSNVLCWMPKPTNKESSLRCISLLVTTSTMAKPFGAKTQTARPSTSLSANIIPIFAQIFAAHTHKRRTKLVYQNHRLIASELYSPALSTSHGNLPGAKLFDFNDQGILTKQHHPQICIQPSRQHQLAAGLST